MTAHMTAHATDAPLITPAYPPSHARIVIIGGGIMGCSVAYHLSALGVDRIVLLEQGRLTCGTTWHAAGLVGQLRAHESMTRLIRYSTELYARLEAETGLATGWKQCGSVNVAKTPERMQVLRKQLAMARSFGVECHEISPAEALEKYPILRIDDLCRVGEQRLHDRDQHCQGESGQRRVSRGGEEVHADVSGPGLVAACELASRRVVALDEEGRFALVQAEIRLVMGARRDPGEFAFDVRELCVLHQPED